MLLRLSIAQQVSKLPLLLPTEIPRLQLPTRMLHQEAVVEAVLLHLQVLQERQTEIIPELTEETQVIVERVEIVVHPLILLNPVFLILIRHMLQCQVLQTIL